MNFGRESLAFGDRNAVDLVDYHQVCQADMLIELGMFAANGGEIGSVDQDYQAAVDDRRVLTSEDESNHVPRLGKPAGLDDDHVDPGLPVRQLVQHLVHVRDVDSAAQTAVAERDHRIDLTGDHHRVDVDGAEVVDDHADAYTVVVTQKMVEQRRLARTEKACDDYYGNLLLRHHTTFRNHTYRSVIVVECGSGRFTLTADSHRAERTDVRRASVVGDVRIVHALYPRDSATRRISLQPAASMTADRESTNPESLSGSPTSAHE